MDKKSRRYRLMNGILHRVMAIAMGAVLLAGQFNVPVYAQEEFAAYEASAGQEISDEENEQESSDETGQPSTSDGGVETSGEPETEIPGDEKLTDEDIEDTEEIETDLTGEEAAELLLDVEAEEVQTEQESAKVTEVTPREVNVRDEFTIGRLTYTYFGHKVDSEGNILQNLVSVRAANKEDISGRLEIPAKVTYEGQEFEVSRIEEDGFSGCKELEDVVMQGSVISIMRRAFSGCEKLVSISGVESVREIGESAFQGCKKLKSFSIPAGVKEISWYTFLDCYSLEQIEIPSSVTMIRNAAFYECRSLTEVEISEGLTTIGHQVFQNCPNLEKISIPASVKEIGGSAFANCVNLKSISIPNGIQNIEPATFDGCRNLSQMEIAVTVTDSSDGKRVTPISAPEAENTFRGYSGTEERKLFFLTADSSERLTGGALNAARTAYLSVDDGDMTDDLWYGWKVPEADDSGTTGEENPPKGDNDPDNPENLGNGIHGGGNSENDLGNGEGGNNGGSTTNTDNTSVPTAEVMITVVDSNVQAAPAVVTETEAPAAQNGQNQTAADTQGKEPETGDSTYLEIYATLAMIAGLTYMLLYFIEEGRGMSEREKEVFVAAFIRWAKKGGTFRKCCALVAIFCILAYYHSVGKCRKEKLYPVLH